MTRAIIDLADPSIEAHADILKCVMAGRVATYLSTPITTGRRFVDWFSRRGQTLDPKSEQYRQEHEREVIEPNCQAARHRLEVLRSTDHRIVIEPTALVRPAWDQDQYRYFWGKVIERYVERVIFIDGWQYSSGCCYEFLTALRSKAGRFNEAEVAISLGQAIDLISTAATEMERLGLSVVFLREVLRELQADSSKTETAQLLLDRAGIAKAVEVLKGETYKDAVLDELARAGNVAQFVSFGPSPAIAQRFCRIHGFKRGHLFESVEQAIAALLSAASDGTVNIRSFRPDKPKGEPLLYGIKTVQEVVARIKERADRGLYTIVNETIDVKDGGVSGVVLGNLIEFAPDDTPKGVDKPGICAMPRDAGLRFLQTVYGFRPALDYDHNYRVEFSIHPRQRGLRQQQTIVWELEESDPQTKASGFAWPNRFSRMLGDKVFGLLIADLIGLHVPRTTVISRRVAPFTFGRQTGLIETWMRTCPSERAPGKFVTTYGWSDPFEATEGSKTVASVLAQEAVLPRFSGSLIASPDGSPVIEGVEGKGDKFMLGEAAPLRELPSHVISAVERLYQLAAQALGPVEMEWVYDGDFAWVVQLHLIKNVHSRSEANGNHVNYVPFDVNQGLEELRKLLSELNGKAGVELMGDVGVTSHFGDLLRQGRIPSRIVKPDGTIVSILE